MKGEGHGVGDYPPPRRAGLALESARCLAPQPVHADNMNLWIGRECHFNRTVSTTDIQNTNPAFSRSARNDSPPAPPLLISLHHKRGAQSLGLCERYEAYYQFVGRRSALRLRVAGNAMIRGLHHVQLAMPPGREDDARAFYHGVLGMTEQPKPANLARRGGVWFVAGEAHLHLGVETDFRPARKAHPALLVTDLAVVAERCRSAGYEVTSDEPLLGYDRVYVTDPFGNRLELLQPAAG